MTPKEKAKDLIKKFYPEVQWKLGQEDCLDRAKRCALTAVDEILNLPFEFESERKYWAEVKQEIISL